MMQHDDDRRRLDAALTPFPIITAASVPPPGFTLTQLRSALVADRRLIREPRPQAWPYVVLALWVGGVILWWAS